MNTTTKNHSLCHHEKPNKKRKLCDDCLFSLRANSILKKLGVYQKDNVDGSWWSAVKLIKKLYIEEKKSMRQISKEYNINIKSLSEFFRNHLERNSTIRRRNRSEAQKVAVETKRQKHVFLKGNTAYMNRIKFKETFEKLYPPRRLDTEFIQEKLNAMRSYERARRKEAELGIRIISEEDEEEYQRRYFRKNY